MVNNSDDEIDWNYEIDNYQSTPPSSSRGRDSPLPQSPVHHRQETLVQNSPTQANFSDEMFASLVDMEFPVDMIHRAMKEAKPKAEISDIIDIMSKYSNNEEASSSKSKTVNHFLAMGFNEENIIKVVNKLGDDNLEAIANELLSCEDETENLPEENEDVNLIDISSDDEKDLIQTLVRMGFSAEDASLAVERCGEDMCMAELTDMIYAVQMAREFDQRLDESEQPTPRPENKKRRLQPRSISKPRSSSSYDSEPVRLPNPMIGFGLPNEPPLITDRELSPLAQAPPYFYYENVACAPRGVWATISSHLYNIKPEFVDSKYICAAARKRGYIHNLPIDNRFQVEPIPKSTIQEALPHTKKWWPRWDDRTKLNCILTGTPTGPVMKKILTALEPHNNEPPPEVQKDILENCRKWNLVWVGKNKVGALEPSEMEILLGFPHNHTRGGGTSTTDRRKSLGNTFQVDTVAYHLSVLKSLFPNGINVLSLFTGIGGAEVALHRLGIPMNTVVSVEISEVNRTILKAFWQESNQRGKLVEYADVKALTNKEIEELMEEHGGFDLVIGGSPCNNLAGTNRVSRTGLEGEHSSLFFEYCRILEAVRQKTESMRSYRV